MKQKVKLNPVDEMILINSGYGNNLTIKSSDRELGSIIKDYITRKYRGIELNIKLVTP